MLTDGLTEGCHSDSVTATVHSQDSLKGVPGPQQAPQAQQQADGDSAEAPMQVDADAAQLHDRCVFPSRVWQVKSPPPSAPCPPPSHPPFPALCPAVGWGVGAVLRHTICATLEALKSALTVLLCMLWTACCACFDCPAVHAAAAPLCMLCLVCCARCGSPAVHTLVIT